MSTKKKGFVLLSKEWAKHLGFGKTLFWSAHRKAEQRQIKKELEIILY